MCKYIHMYVCERGLGSGYVKRRSARGGAPLAGGAQVPSQMSSRVASRSPPSTCLKWGLASRDCKLGTVGWGFEMGFGSWNEWIGDWGLGSGVWRWGC